MLPVSRRLSSLLSLTRWASPPDNVVADCLSRAYENVGEQMTSPILPEADHEWDDEFAEVQTVFGALNSSVVTLDAVAAATGTLPDSAPQ